MIYDAVAAIHARNVRQVDESVGIWHVFMSVKNPRRRRIVRRESSRASLAKKHPERKKETGKVRKRCGGCLARAFRLISWSGIFRFVATAIRGKSTRLRDLHGRIYTRARLINLLPDD